MKLIGILLIAAVGIWLGISASLGLGKRVTALSQAEKLVTSLRSRIRYTAAPVQELLMEAQDSGEYPALRFLQYVCWSLKTAAIPDVQKLWEDSLKKADGAPGLNRQDIELLTEFGRGLGTSDVEGQISHCELYQELLQKQMETARQDVSSKGRLYVTLGITGGLGLALLLL